MQCLFQTVNCEGLLFQQFSLFDYVYFKWIIQVAVQLVNGLTM